MDLLVPSVPLVQLTQHLVVQWVPLVQLDLVVQWVPLHLVRPEVLLAQLDQLDQLVLLTQGLGVLLALSDQSGPEHLVVLVHLVVLLLLVDQLVLSVQLRL